MRRNPLAPQFAVALFFSWCLTGGDSAAEVRISGMQDRVVLQANDASVPEIIAALRRAIGLEVTLRGTVEKKFTGMYSGSVHYVLTRLFTSENYILQTTSSGIKIVLLGQSVSDDEARPGLLALQRPRLPAPHIVTPSPDRQSKD
jgi:hypothetical protein